MSLLSLHYFVFLAAVVLLACRTRRVSVRNTCLLFASYYFYASWDWRFASLLLVNTIVHFIAARHIAAAHSDQRRAVLLALALGVSFLILGYFKYAGFFVDSLWTLLNASGINVEKPILQLTLPIGISFYTFQCVSYTLDVWRKDQRPCESFRDFALFVAFFPTVLSGPITRARLLLPQLEQPSQLPAAQVENGLLLIVRGAIKKILFADVLALHLVNPAFANPSEFAWWFLVLAVYGFTFQLYMDLSAYTDIARGSAKLLGFELPENFNRPYLASSVSNFWQRWHITMSSFFRDYLYFGMGGSKRGNVYFNLMVTFLAIGMWHGAGWNFAVYGLIHGSFVGLERVLRNRRKQRGATETSSPYGTHVVGMLLAFHVVAFSRILFRAPDLPSAWNYLQHIVAGGGGSGSLSITAATVLVAATLLHLVPKQRVERALESAALLPVWLQAIGLAAVSYVLIAFSSGEAGFIYFEF